MDKRKKQTTLFRYNFSKNIKHRDSFVSISASLFPEESKLSIFGCNGCMKQFNSNLGRIMHEAWFQNCIDSKGNTNCSLLDNVNDIKTEVNFVTKEILNSVEIHESKEIDDTKNKKKGCGADKR